MGISVLSKDSKKMSIPMPSKTGVNSPREVNCTHTNFSQRVKHSDISRSRNKTQEMIRIGKGLKKSKTELENLSSNFSEVEIESHY